MTRLTPVSAGRWLAYGAVPTPARAGYPLHIVDDSGRFIRSFGPEPPQYPSPPGCCGFSLSSAKAAWLYSSIRYEMSRWDTTGKLIAKYRRAVDWFPTWKPGDWVQYANFTAAEVDDRGRLWTVIVLRRQTASADEPSSRGEPGSGTYKISTFDTMIEVSDLRIKRVLTGFRIRGTSLWPLGAGFFALLCENPPTEEPNILVVRLRVVQRSIR